MNSYPQSVQCFTVSDLIVWSCGMKTTNSTPFAFYKNTVAINFLGNLGVSLWCMIPVLESTLVSRVTLCTQALSMCSIPKAETCFLLWDSKLDFCPQHAKIYNPLHLYAYPLLDGSSHHCCGITSAYTQH